MKTHFSTVWVVGDLETAEGRLLAYNAVKYLKRSHTMRIAIINNPRDVSAIFILEFSKFCENNSHLMNRLLKHWYKYFSFELS